MPACLPAKWGMCVCACFDTLSRLQHLPCTVSQHRNLLISYVCWSVCACAHLDCGANWPVLQQPPCTALHCHGFSETSCLAHTLEQKHLLPRPLAYGCAACSASASGHLHAELVHFSESHPAEMHDRNQCLAHSPKLLATESNPRSANLHRCAGI